jgi:hypothetical protein
MRIGSKENDLDRAQFRCRARFRVVRRRSVPMIRVEPTIHESCLEFTRFVAMRKIFFVSPRPYIFAAAPLIWLGEPRAMYEGLRGLRFANSRARQKFLELESVILFAGLYSCGPEPASVSL